MHPNGRDGTKQMQLSKRQNVSESCPARLLRGKPGHRQPWHYRFPNDRAFAFAGLWEHSNPPDGEPVETCTIVTTAANEFSAKYHNRMPVILDGGDYRRWLDAATPTDRLLPLLESRPVDGLEVHAANPLVNSPQNQGPELLVPGIPA
jgi:putative SOS response-associated peptidase YedK